MKGAVTRRDLLRAVPALGVATLAPQTLAGCGDDDGGDGAISSGTPGTDVAFRHGVASGDPMPDEGDPLDACDPAPVPGGERDLGDRQRSGVHPDRAIGQRPDHRRPRFHREGRRDRPDGRNDLLLPLSRRSGGLPDRADADGAPGAVSRARFGVVSCSSFAQGYFHAYRALARRPDLDAVIHLGDYIYESASGMYGTSARTSRPPRRSPWPTTAPATPSTSAIRTCRRCTGNIRSSRCGTITNPPTTPGATAPRTTSLTRETGQRARRPRSGPTPSGCRSASSRARPHLAQARPGGSGRSRAARHPAAGAHHQQLGAGWSRPTPDPARTLLGDDQASWLEDQLRQSTATWKLVGQQVMVANLILSPGMLANLDQWHGYPESRRRFLDFLRTAGASNVVVLTGDIHSSWANELVVDPGDPAQYDPATGRGAVAVEHGGPGDHQPRVAPGLRTPWSSRPALTTRTCAGSIWCARATWCWT